MANLQAKTAGLLLQLMTWIYDLGIFFYSIFVRCAAIKNVKARLWLAGRKNLITDIEQRCQNLPPSFWMHCPSLGEFEQGRPVLETLRKQHPGVPIILTFFSPSGYEVRKNYSGADYVFYLPTDSRKNARRFISAINPKMALFVKYDFWLHYLTRLKQRKCTTLLISGIFRPNHHFFKPWGIIGKKMLDCFDHFFVQDEQSIKLLSNAGYKNATISGDTRFDRVVALQKESQEISVARQFSGNNFTVVAGSTWPADEVGIAKWINANKNARLIIAPHQISEPGLRNFEKLLHCNSVRFSKANSVSLNETSVLIIDNIGMLSSLYQYASVAYVGGGFGSGIHNTLEAAVWGVPVVFGPNNKKFKEAQDLIALGAAKVAHKFEDISTLLVAFEIDTTARTEAGNIAARYVREHIGATTIITNYISAFKK